MTDTTDEKPPIKVVYLGTRITSDGKLHAAFATAEHVAHAINQGSELAPASALAWQKASYFDDTRHTQRMIVGALYDVVGSLGDNGRVASMATQRATFDRRCPDAQLVVDLEFSDKAARGEKAGLAKLAKLRKEPALLDEIKMLRRAYQGTNGAGRIAMEIAILSALRTPVRL